MQTTRTNRRLALVLAAALGLGALGITAPAGADIGDITSCTDPTHGARSATATTRPSTAPTTSRPAATARTSPSRTPTRELPEAQPGGRRRRRLPPADVDGTVVADANFTG